MTFTANGAAWELPADCTVTKEANSILIASTNDISFGTAMSGDPFTAVLAYAGGSVTGSTTFA